MAALVSHQAFRHQTAFFSCLHGNIFLPPPRVLPSGRETRSLSQCHHRKISIFHRTANITVSLTIRRRHLLLLSPRTASHQRPGEQRWPLLQVADVPGLHLPHPALQRAQRLHLLLLPLLVSDRHSCVCVRARGHAESLTLSPCRTVGMHPETLRFFSFTAVVLVPHIIGKTLQKESSGSTLVSSLTN